MSRQCYLTATATTLRYEKAEPFFSNPFIRCAFSHFLIHSSFCKAMWNVMHIDNENKHHKCTKILQRNSVFEYNEEWYQVRENCILILTKTLLVFSLECKHFDFLYSHVSFSSVILMAPMKWQWRKTPN